MDAIDPKIRCEIDRELNAIEQTSDVTVLYACESGSRSWGFASADSDYDVRFVYVRPREWYLSINVEHRRDVIERPIDDVLDISGWDLRKALQLFRKSNPPLHEWLQSPHVYRQRGDAIRQLQQLAVDAYNPVAAHYHYLSMATSTYRAMTGDLVRRKKYLYALRCLLAVSWIEQGRGVVPMEFDVLVEALVNDATVSAAIANLLVIKRGSAEIQKGVRLPVLDAFIQAELDRHANATPLQPAPKVDIERLNALFRDTLAADAR
ncbi:MAG: nucleotidyltransferase domain-containing protein [Planctomycetaceae bacterium]|nr:nucleotidyltransferase domain-containing protein [Planctomycetaceae bacterium]